VQAGRLGHQEFVLGVNLPWFAYGGDFGCNAWSPEGGMARPDRQRELDLLFAHLAEAGAHVVRWFLLCDGRAGLCEDEDGCPDGLDERTLVDLAAAVSAAEAHGLALIPALLDFHWCHPRRHVSGVQCGGRALHLADRGRRARLLEHVLRPMLSRFGGRDGIVAWDVINEPEWVTFSWASWDPRRALLPDVMCDYIAEAAALVHECSDQAATVGLATAASLPRVRGLGLDLYQAHWYDKLEALAPLATPVSAFGLDAPVILGEFPTRGSGRSPDEIAQLARAAGYRGALAWSLRADDGSSDREAVWSWLERAQAE
jgi:hypothetical protein